MANKMNKTIIFCKEQINGFFEFEDFFRIYPCDHDDFSRSKIYNLERPIILETLIPMPMQPYDKGYGEEIERRISIENEIIMILSVFSRTFFYKNNTNTGWFIDHQNLNCIFGQKGYRQKLNKEFDKNSFKRIDNLDPQNYYNSISKTIDCEVAFPSDISDLIKRYYSLNEDIKNSFLSATSLFYQGLQLFSSNPSIAFTCFISSIETMVAIHHKNTENDVCRECNRERYAVTKKFNDFIIDRVNGNDVKKLANKLYSIRSKMLHTGVHLATDNLISNDFGKNWFSDKLISMELVKINRFLLVSFLCEIT